MPETQEMQELLKAYIDLLPLGLLLFDSNKKLLSFNKYVLSSFRIDQIKENSFGLVTNQINEIIENIDIAERELVGLPKPHKAKKIITSDGKIILVIIEINQESIGEMSHELRRPITNIKTLTESLLFGAKNEPEILDKFLTQINSEVDRLARLVNELLNLSKIKSGKLQCEKKKINLRDKAEDAIKLLSSQAEKSKTKLINQLPDKFEIFGDPEQVDHIVQNLIENAIKYSPENSQVTIKPGPVEGSFQVDDTGIGIPELEINKIFERFYRIDRTKAKGSSGLGLAIVKNIIDIHGGKIEVKSKIQEGSSFIVYLPID